MKFRVFEQTRVALKFPPPYGSIDVGFVAITTVTCESMGDALVIGKLMYPKICRRIAVEPIHERVPEDEGGSGRAPHFNEAHAAEYGSA